MEIIGIIDHRIMIYSLDEQFLSATHSVTVRGMKSPNQLICLITL